MSFFDQWGSRTTPIFQTECSYLALQYYFRKWIKPAHGCCPSIPAMYTHCVGGSCAYGLHSSQAFGNWLRRVHIWVDSGWTLGQIHLHIGWNRKNNTATLLLVCVFFLPRILLVKYCVSVGVIQSHPIFIVCAAWGWGGVGNTLTNKNLNDEGKTVCVCVHHKCVWKE